MSVKMGLSLSLARERLLAAVLSEFARAFAPLTCLLIWATTAGIAPLSATDLYVDFDGGNDRADGQSPSVDGPHGPVKTIARGIRIAGPGDTVHLAKGTWREPAVFHNRKGEPDRPIVLDGHGATIEGSDPLIAADWTEVSPGLFRHDNLLRLDDAIIGRWFFLFDGTLHHMRRSSKGPSQPLKSPDQLQPGEWTFVLDPGRAVPPSRNIYGAFYIQLAPGTKLEDARIAAPIRSSGVVLSGDCAHLVVRNLTATRVHNDGFNLHGTSRDCRFENIVAIDCGDDGFSAHDDCQAEVDGFVSIGNSTGICDTGHSVTGYRRVLIRDCLGHDLYFLDTNRHRVRDSVVLSSAWRALAVIGKDGGDNLCSMELDNVFLRRERGSSEARVTRQALLDARRLTLLGVHLQPTGGEVRLHDSVIAGKPHPEVTLWPDVTWKADRNVYDLKFLRRDKTFFNEKSFAQFQQETGQDGASVYRTVAVEDGRPVDIPAESGADLTTLAELFRLSEQFTSKHAQWP